MIKVGTVLYKGMVLEWLEQRLITKKLRKRYKEAKLEIDDLTKEFATFK